MDTALCSVVSEFEETGLLINIEEDADGTGEQQAELALDCSGLVLSRGPTAAASMQISQSASVVM